MSFVAVRFYGKLGFTSCLTREAIMKQGRKLVLGAMALVLMLGVLVIGGIRGGRGRFSPPNILKPNLASIEVGHVHAFAARVGTNVVLFDTGPDPDGQGLDVLLKALAAVRADVHDIFLTHGHGDHIAGAGLFPQARVWAGAGDVALCAGTVSPEALAARVMGWINQPPPVQVAHALNTDESVDVGVNQRVRAIPTPGHTPGSYAFLYDGVLFVGDTISLRDDRLQPTPALFSPHPDADRQTALDLKAALGDVPVDRVCTAHGGCTQAGTGQQALVDFVRTLQR